jgi:hypothetical protein
MRRRPFNAKSGEEHELRPSTNLVTDLVTDDPTSQLHLQTGLESPH